jgi:hypothetical protein
VGFEQISTQFLAAEAGRDEHTGCYRLAVREVVSGGGLQTVTDSVAVVKSGARACLTLILSHHGGLEAHRVQDQGLQRFLVPSARFRDAL